MKYEATIHRTEQKNVQVCTDNRDDALKLIRDSNPGFTADGLVELGEDDEPGENHEVFGACENCEKTIWEGEEYVPTADDVMLCVPCWRSIRGEQNKAK